MCRSRLLVRTCRAMLPWINSLARKTLAIPRLHYSGLPPGRLWQDCYSGAAPVPTHNVVPHTPKKPESVAHVQRGEHCSGRGAAGHAVAERRVERTSQNRSGVGADDPKEGEPRPWDPGACRGRQRQGEAEQGGNELPQVHHAADFAEDERLEVDRKSTRLNSSHVSISYAVVCL